MDHITINTSVTLDLNGHEKVLGISRRFSFNELIQMGNGAAINQNIADEVGRQVLVAMTEGRARAIDADQQSK